MRAVVGASLVSTLLLLSWRSEAKDPLIVVPGTSSLSGEHSYSHVVIQSMATLKVPNGSPMGASVTIKATTIVIEEGGTIDASGAGFPGVDNMNGNGPVGGGLAGFMNQPGGGGGHYGAGGPGTSSADCTDIGAAGGMAYSMITQPLAGSAGGAAGVPGNMPIGTKGGNGGGQVILEASRIEIRGSVLAEGNPGLFKPPWGAGGGAGGAIHIKAFELVVTGTARISVKGGDGGRAIAPAIDSGRGGGGSGGFIIIEAPPIDTAFLDTTGGDGCDPANGNGDGAPGAFELRTPPPTCLDLDRDGSLGCDREDCDDVDPGINPDAEEKCDGVDTDCDGKDEEEETKADGSPLCGEAQKCALLDADLNHVCVEDPDAGTSSTGGPGGPAPGEVRFIGGCGAANPDPDRSSRGAANADPDRNYALAAAVVAALAALARRRRLST